MGAGGLGLAAQLTRGLEGDTAGLTGAGASTSVGGGTAAASTPSGQTSTVAATGADAAGSAAGVRA